MCYYAHTPNRLGRWQYWDEHSEQVGNLAKEFGDSFDQGELAKCCGLVHDIADGRQQDIPRKLIRVKIAISDIGALVHQGNKIRCCKMTVLEEVPE